LNKQKGLPKSKQQTLEALFLCGAYSDTYLLLSVIMGIHPFGEGDKMPLGTPI